MEEHAVNGGGTLGLFACVKVQMSNHDKLNVVSSNFAFTASHHKLIFPRRAQWGPGILAPNVRPLTATLNAKVLLRSQSIVQKMANLTFKEGALGEIGDWVPTTWQSRTALLVSLSVFTD